MKSFVSAQGYQGCIMPPPPEVLARLLEEADAGRQAESGDSIVVPATQFSFSKETILDGHYGLVNPAFERAGPLRGPINLLVCLVDFEDKAMAPDMIQHFQDLFFSTNGEIPTGSVTQFYSEASGGLVSMTGKVVGPFRMPHTSAYYANGQSGYSRVEPNFGTLGNDALSAVVAAGSVNMKEYDNDGNGYVDAFVVVHAGQAAESTRSPDDLWSVQSWLPQEQVVDGVTIYPFLSIAEDARVGVCVHELGHLVFGWPDLYDTDGGVFGIIGVVSSGVGMWCCMSNGSWNGGGHRPCHPSAWCKAQQGWVTTITDTENKAITLTDVKHSQEVHRLWTNGNYNHEYYLIENRGLTGFDTDLQGPGLLVWHIDEWQSNNRDETHLKVGLVQADGRDSLAKAFGDPAWDQGNDGDPYPGSYNNLAFTTTTYPSSRGYDQKENWVSIRDISPWSDSMNFKITVQPFSTRFVSGDGIAGCDLEYSRVRIFAFDYNSMGRQDHLVIISPGRSTCYIVAKKEDGTFETVYKSENGQGIGHQYLKDRAAKAFAFDYDTSGKQDHILFYTPGRGSCSVVKHVPDFSQQFTTVFKSNTGIGRFDLSDEIDQVFAFDYDHSGKQDHICVYRPGSGIFAIFRPQENQSFMCVFGLTQKFGIDQGIGGFDLKNSADRAFAFDYDREGKLDHIAIYRPGAGRFWIIRNNSGIFVPVYTTENIGQGHTGVGIGGYDLKSPDDKLFAYDWMGIGKQDHVAIYRPGTGTFWCIRSNQGIYEAAMSEGQGSIIIQGDNRPREGPRPRHGLQSNWTPKQDPIIDTNLDTDTIPTVDTSTTIQQAILKSAAEIPSDDVTTIDPSTDLPQPLPEPTNETNPGSAGDQQANSQIDPDLEILSDQPYGKGLGGWDLLDENDRIVPFDYESTGKLDHLVVYRPGKGGIWILAR